MEGLRIQCILPDEAYVQAGITKVLDYQKSVNKGSNKNSSAMRWLKENDVLFGKANWFMLDPKTQRKGYVKPSSSCYQWVEDKLMKQSDW